MTYDKWLSLRGIVILLSMNHRFSSLKAHAFAFTLFGRMSQRIHSEMSSREIEVLRLIAQGRSNKEIASELGIVEGDVKAHVTNIFGKLGAMDRTQAITIVMKRQILQLE